MTTATLQSRIDLSEVAGRLGWSEADLLTRSHLLPPSTGYGDGQTWSARQLSAWLANGGQPVRYEGQAVATRIILGAGAIRLMPEPAGDAMRQRAAAEPSTMRAIAAVVATESPVAVWDVNRGEVVDEVLLMSRAKMPSESARVPFLDSHDRQSVGGVIGTAGGLLVEAGLMLASIAFSSAAERVYALVTEGHLTDVSIGYKAHARQFVGKGESVTIDGREFTGPVNLVTDWTIKEVSAVSVGADPNAQFIL